ncbi:hypothetical protein P4482_13720 [Neobacillus thermocopriae]|uniref:hypothetical protein n=1 Tax=Neobacillus thermocopriae TaxID=1215031 RepID=UPI002E22050E|nr:hypothetical protein [Neobacillus thermocopriae]MED3715244.1 hypothetical protein [Neobacillus thermocopriae]
MKNRTKTSPPAIPKMIFFQVNLPFHAKNNNGEISAKSIIDPATIIFVSLGMNWMPKEV